jgi:hypothetical protein
MHPPTVGLELELLAPRGRTRADLAHALGPTVRRGWHLDSEPSLVPGRPVFHNLTPAFDVFDADGDEVGRVMDDLTIQDDLDRAARPVPGWFRIVSDDLRLLRLARRTCDPDLPLETTLQGMRDLFEGTITVAEGGLHRLADPWGAPLAIAAPLPGERERPAEVATARLRGDPTDALRHIVTTATALGFTVPVEAAVHVHLDAAGLEDAATLHHLAGLVHGREDALRAMVRSNPRCRRLGPWSDKVKALLLDPDFAALPWPEARAKLAAAEVSKYVDLNLRNLVHPSPNKHTIEWRIFPGSLDLDELVAAAALLRGLGQAAVERTPAPLDLASWLDALPLDPAIRAWWRARL